MENSKQKINFITFGGGNNKFRNRVKEMTDHALELKIFNNIYGFTDYDLKKDLEFWNKHKDFINSNSRGFGYWIWKPYLILKILNEIDENDIIIYSDVGCTLTNNKDGYYKYIDVLNDSEYGILSFVLTQAYEITPVCFEKIFTKSDLFNYFEYFDQTKLKETLQRHATAILIKKNEHSCKFINKWYELSCNYHFIDDSPSIIPNDLKFIENRHDQSVFSILTKIYGSEKLNENNDVIITFPKNRGDDESEYNENTITIYKNLL